MALKAWIIFPRKGSLYFTYITIGGNVNFPSNGFADFPSQEYSKGSLHFTYIAVGNVNFPSNGFADFPS